MREQSTWDRVSKAKPCPICEKPDWCTISGDGAVVHCRRVQSDRATEHGGWLHRIGESKPTYRRLPPPPTAPTIDAAKLINNWIELTSPERLEDEAIALGVTQESMMALQAAWASVYNAWAFPMRGHTGHPVGIRLRASDGRKWAVTGSKQGCFIPQETPFSLKESALITEGPTDTAAALSIGMYAIGRPSCNTGGLEIRHALQRTRHRSAVLIADNDQPGIDGANVVGKMLGVPFCILILPCKDMRQFVGAGGDKQDINNLIKDTVWSKQ